MHRTWVYKLEARYEAEGETTPVAIGAALVFFCFPRREAEQELLQRYQSEDAPVLVQPPASSSEQ